jgi:hypothetical protein
MEKIEETIEGEKEILACSFDLSATSQHYFSLRTNQPTILSS